jgi:hypothetical protein
MVEEWSKIDEYYVCYLNKVTLRENTGKLAMAY